jgi:hypothetical protein
VRPATKPRIVSPPNGAAPARSRLYVIKKAPPAPAVPASSLRSGGTAHSQPLVVATEFTASRPCRRSPVVVAGSFIGAVV